MFSHSEDQKSTSRTTIQKGHGKMLKPIRLLVIAVPFIVMMVLIALMSRPTAALADRPFISEEWWHTDVWQNHTHDEKNFEAPEGAVYVEVEVFWEWSGSYNQNQQNEEHDVTTPLGTVHCIDYGNEELENKMILCGTLEGEWNKDLKVEAIFTGDDSSPGSHWTKVHVSWFGIEPTSTPTEVISDTVTPTPTATPTNEPNNPPTPVPPAYEVKAGCKSVENRSNVPVIAVFRTEGGEIIDREVVQPEAKHNWRKEAPEGKKMFVDVYDVNDEHLDNPVKTISLGQCKDEKGYTDTVGMCPPADAVGLKVELDQGTGYGEVWADYSFGYSRESLWFDYETGGYTTSPSPDDVTGEWRSIWFYRLYQPYGYYKLTWYADEGKTTEIVSYEFPAQWQEQVQVPSFDGPVNFFQGVLPWGCPPVPTETFVQEPPAVLPETGGGSVQNGQLGHVAILAGLVILTTGLVMGRKALTTVSIR
jgi:hypothetical protein